MTTKALCIGINDYPGTANDLSGCVNDANDWAAEFRRRGFEVRLMLDTEAKLAAMIGGISDLITTSVKGDNLIITYSGHGTWVPDSSDDEPDGRDEALCPYDLATSGALLDDVIHALFSRRPAGVRILLISDSCHSGSVTRGKEDDLDPGLAKIRFMPPEAWMAKDQLPPPELSRAIPRGGFTRTGGDLLLAGCQDSEYSWDTSFQGRPNGAFTYYALKTLREIEPRNYDAWFRAIRSYLPSTHLPQSPQIFGTRTARLFKVFQ